MNGIADVLQGAAVLFVGQELGGKDVVGDAAFPQQQGLRQLVPAVHGGVIHHGASLDQHLVGACCQLHLADGFVLERDRFAGVARELFLHDAAAAAALSLEHLRLMVSLKAAETLQLPRERRGPLSFSTSML